MTQLSRHSADAAEPAYNNSCTHDDFVRQQRTYVNVDNVHICMRNAYMLTIGQRLRVLRERSGLSVRALAQAASYKTGSGVQEYLQPHYDKALPLPVARKLSEALAGKGEPPIDSSEIYRLTGVFPSEEALQEMFFALLTPDAIAEGRAGLSEILAKRLPEAFSLALDELQRNAMDGGCSPARQPQHPSSTRQRTPPEQSI